MTEHPDSSAEVEAPDAGQATADATASDEVPAEGQAPADVLDEEAAQDHTPIQSTGHPAVDEVLRSLDALDERPVDEHVAVFEKAHEDLRRALSDANTGDVGDASSSR